MIQNGSDTIMRSCMCLSEGLDYPSRRHVVLTAENSLLRYLAPMPRMESCWNALAGWLESVESEEERLKQLRTAYYEMFLSWDTDLYVHLHRWYPERSPGECIGEFTQFLRQVDMDLNPEWRNGADHVSLVFETLAHLLISGKPQIPLFVKKFFLPWFSTFAGRLQDQANHTYYRAISIIAGEFHHDVKGLT